MPVDTPAAATRPRRTYLDHAASSPMVPAAVEALARHAGLVGNPHAQHASGRRARAVLEDAREQLAALLGVRPDELLFTAGGSEADTIAMSAGAAVPGRPRILLGPTEHVAVAGLRDRGEHVQVLACDQDGVVLLDQLAERLGVDVALVSVMAANNETGTLQPLTEVVQAGHAAGALVHSDVVQAFGHVDLDVAALGLDLASMSAHKLGGPVGIGALVARRDVRLPAHGLGGGQERRVRSGTQPVALAAAFAAAAQQAVDTREQEAARLTGLRSRLVDGVLATVEDVRVNGGSRVLPGICNLTVDGTRADDVLMLLDGAGIDCSTGSACHAGVHQPSEVLLAMGRDLAAAQASVRFSMGWSTTSDDVERLLAVLPDVVRRARLAHG